jgi:hypothetical protein
VELIGLAPDVGSRASDFVLTAPGVEFRRPLYWRGADVIGIREKTNITGLRVGARRQQT